MQISKHARKHGSLMVVVAAVGIACAKADVGDGMSLNSGSGPGTGGVPGGTGFSFGGQSAGPLPVALPCAGDICEDFPKEPIIEAGAEDAPGLFADPPAAGAGPCVLEPEDGSLFPNNWLRPRIKWSGSTGPTEIRISAERQANDLVVYTTANEWKMPKNIWMNLASHIRGEDITVSVRQAGGGATSVNFAIAFAEAAGSMVYWAARPSEVGKDPSDATALMDSELRGFTVGDESTTTALTISDVQQQSREQSMEPRSVKCIGCHVATPDGQFVAFTDHWPWNTAIAGVKPGITGQPLPEMSSGGLSALNRPWGGMMTFSPLHWFPGDKKMVVASSLRDPRQPWATDNRQPAQLVWYDLEAPSPMDEKFTEMGQQFGIIARNGDTRGAASPDWSDATDRIVYASTMGGNMDGRLEQGPTDLYIVPYNDGAGGPAEPVPGGSDPGFEEYYPSWSPDERFIVYNRVPSGQRMYANPNAELFVAATTSPQPIRLDANDPPACSGKSSPGINNHWARWSPAVQTVGSSKIYWIIFSSNRSDIPPVQSRYVNPGMQNGSNVEVSQLYMTAIVEDENGIKTFPAIYLWNQSTETLNTTPAWEGFFLPPVE